MARDAATFLREHYFIDRIVVVGDLVAPGPLNLWSELVLVVWGLPEVERTHSESGRIRYTSPEAMLFQSGYANARQLVTTLEFAWWMLVKISPLPKQHC